jgi:predicted MFS family arabinose efflux permease
MIQLHQDSKQFSSIYAVSIVGFFFAFSYQMVAPILPIYSVNNVGANIGELAAIVAFGSLASAISKFITGTLIRLKRSLTILLLGLILFTVSNYLYLVVLNPRHLMMVRFLHGMSLGVVVTLALSLIAVISRKGLRGRSIGLYTSLVALGLMAGPGVGSIIIELWGLESVFLILSILGVFPVVLLFFLKSRLKLQTNNLSEYGSLRMLRRVLSNQTMLICFFAYLGYTIFFGSFNAYIPIYLNRNFGISAQLVSALFFGFYLFSSTARFRLDTVVRKIGDRGGLVLGFLNYMFFSLLLFIMPEKYLTLASVVLMGFSHGLIFPLLAIRISRAIPYEHLILANSLYLIAFDLGAIIGPTSTSILAQYHSIPLAITASILPAFAILPFIIAKK